MCVCDCQSQYVVQLGPVGLFQARTQLVTVNWHTVVDEDDDSYWGSAWLYDITTGVSVVISKSAGNFFSDAYMLLSH